MKKVAILIFALLASFAFIEAARHRCRKKDPDIPTITMSDKKSKKVVSNWALHKYPLCTAYNAEHFNSHKLPTDTITAVNDPQTLFDCKRINKLINQLLREVRRGKKRYAHFTLLQDKNFSYKKKCGLLIVKFNNFPFVLKLFIETPQTLVDPYCKGFETQFLFYLAGGADRHVGGLYRIKNLELVKELIDNHPRWKDKVITPRKWHWIPKNPRWITIKGENFGNEKTITTTIPGVYAIIADAIDTEEDAPLLSIREKSELIMQLCMDLHLLVDPHADNFVIKQIPNTNDYTISIIDTEHFPSMIGLKEEPFFNNHLEWYLYIGAKYFQDTFLRTKQDRRESQNFVSPYAIKW
jgi:hypothetical protein